MAALRASGVASSTGSMRLCAVAFIARLAPRMRSAIDILFIACCLFLDEGVFACYALGFEQQIIGARGKSVDAQGYFARATIGR